MRKWYNEYEGHWRIHDYFSLMINQFPIIVVRRMDNPHSENENMDRIIMIGIFGFTKVYKAMKEDKDIQENIDMTDDEVCPECGGTLIMKMSGGVKCSKCDYLFCY